METHLGKISGPCCIKAPSENHKVLTKEKVSEGAIVDPPFSSSCHSYGLNLPTMYKIKLTAKKPAMIQPQTARDSGSMKENTPGFSRSGLFIMMLIPVFM